MNVYQCKYCSRLLSNDMCFVKEDSNYVEVAGIEDCISLEPTSDPEVYNLNCICKNKVGEGHVKEADKNQSLRNKHREAANKSLKLIYKLKKDSIIRSSIKKLVGHVRGSLEESESDSNNQMISNNIVANDINSLRARVEELEKQLTCINKERCPEKLESLSLVMGGQMAALARLAELVCELHPEMELSGVFPQLF